VGGGVFPPNIHTSHHKLFLVITNMAKKETKKETKKEILVDLEDTQTSDETGNEEEIIVGDPEVLRPVELPLVVKPKDGTWKNEAQTRYAKYLNAYAYKNPKKWSKKKTVLIQRLKEIGENPESIFILEGGEFEQSSNGSLNYKNHLIEK